MIALFGRQPWADLIARRQKPVEVRSWATRYRGPLLICASAKWWIENRDAKFPAKEYTP